MTSLDHYGWSTFFQLKHNNNQEHNKKEDLVIGRIISIQGFKYYVITESGEKEAELSGKLLYGSSTEDLPKVGDWVKLMDYDTLGYIIEVLPRRNELSRKNPGAKTEKQILACNVDYALIVQGLDRDFNIMRLERYLVQLAACEIKPIIILSKADLAEDHSPYAYNITKLQRDCTVIFCSTLTGIGLDELKNNVLEQYKTYILIGSSGVGKSSLLNALMENTVQYVKATSVFNNKGKHTTTTRDLFRLPNGSLMIDTPGMREFGLTSDEGQSSDELFPAIQKFAADCRFSDCKHIHEAGCGVMNAIDTGQLERNIYESYLKLVREQKRFEINAEDKKRMNKQGGKISREAQQHRNKYKN